VRKTIQDHSFILKEFDPSPRPIPHIKVHFSVPESGLVNLVFDISNIESSKIQNFATAQGSFLKKGTDLWKSTCFEFFWKPFGPYSTQYFEWNFTTQKYFDFMSFEKCRKPCSMNWPVAHGGVVDVDSQIDINRGVVTCRLRLPKRDFVSFQTVNPESQINISAILDFQDGSKRYYALKHLNKEKPDFHLF
jgi:hypothetical protein